MTLLSLVSPAPATTSSASAHGLPGSCYAGLVITTLALLLLAAPTSAEELATPVMQQGGDRNANHMPDHAESQSAVRAHFGEPQSVKGPVGEPQIIQWQYADFVVYFEKDHVIHAVAKPDQ